MIHTTKRLPQREIHPSQPFSAKLPHFAMPLADDSIMADSTTKINVRHKFHEVVSYSHIHSMCSHNRIFVVNRGKVTDIQTSLVISHIWAANFRPIQIAPIAMAETI
jgi:hypothetical protein